MRVRVRTLLRAVSCGVFLATPVFALAAAASAQAIEPIRLVYHAAPGCPSEDDFVARIRRAAPGMRLTTSDDASRVFTVTLGEGGGRRGRLRISGSSGAAGSRDVAGARCAEIADILAFAVALAVDPALAETGAPSPPRDATASSPSAPSAASQPVPPSAPAQVPAPSRAVEDDERGHQEQSLPRGRWAAALHASVASADAPNVTVGGSMSLERGWRTAGLVPSVRLGAAFGTSEAVNVDSARATFSSALLIAEASPTQWSAAGFSVRPCARVEVGVRIAEGHDVPGGQAAIRPWVALGPSLGLRQRLASRLFLDLGGEVLFPLIRDRVYLAPDITVHQVPIVGVGSELGLGVEFL